MLSSFSITLFNSSFLPSRLNLIEKVVATAPIVDNIEISKGVTSEGRQSSANCAT